MLDEIWKTGHSVFWKKESSQFLALLKPPKTMVQYDTVQSGTVLDYFVGQEYFFSGKASIS